MKSSTHNMVRSSRKGGREYPVEIAVRVGLEARLVVPWDGLSFRLIIIVPGLPPVSHHIILQ